MGFKISKGIKINRKRYTLPFMHSALGTKRFGLLSSKNKKRWSTFDRVGSRTIFRNQ